MGTHNEQKRAKQEVARTVDGFKDFQNLVFGWVYDVGKELCADIVHADPEADVFEVHDQAVGVGVEHKVVGDRVLCGERHVLRKIDCGFVDFAVFVAGDLC